MMSSSSPSGKMLTVIYVVAGATHTSIYITSSSVTATLHIPLTIGTTCAMTIDGLISEYLLEPLTHPDRGE